MHDLLSALPNVPHESVPIGKEESDNVEVRRWGKAPAFDFEPRDHVDLGNALGILDLERATKIAAARFAILNGAGARLERALVSFMLDVHTREHGYLETLPPFIVNRSALFGTGQLPKFEADLFRLEDDRDLFLIPTGKYQSRIITAKKYLMRRSCAEVGRVYTIFSFRSRKLWTRHSRAIRQHQFERVNL